MAVVNDKKTFIKSARLIIKTDMGMLNDLFPNMQLHTTEEIVYDSAKVEGVAPSYRSFSETANVISKDGKDRVSLKTVNFNDGISKETIDADAEQFGQNEYGDGEIDPEMQSALTGVGKLMLNADVGKKKIAYEALTTHQIEGGYIGKDGKEDIVFNVPSANKEVFDGTTKLYWSNANATPVTDIERAYAAMKIKPSRIVMNDTMFGYFMNSDEVRTADNSSDGTKRNFIQNENVAPEAKYYEAGKLIMGTGKTVSIRVEEEQRYTGAGYTPFLPDGYIIYASPIGRIHYGGIPVAESGGVRRIAAMEDVQELITQNPPQHLVQYRTAPLPALEQGEAYYVQVVEDV